MKQSPILGTPLIEIKNRKIIAETASRLSSREIVSEQLSVRNRCDHYPLLFYSTSFAPGTSGKQQLKENSVTCP